MSSFGKAQQPCHSNVGMLSAHVIPALAGVEAGIYGQKARPCKEVLSDVAWQNVSLQWLEKVRTDLRDLVKFLLGDKKKWFVVDIDDVISDEGEVEGVTPRVSYRQRVMDFLANNRHLPVLDKIYNMEKLEDRDFRELQRIL